MTIKFSRAGTRTILTVPKGPALNLPNSDWTICYVLYTDGQMGVSQYVFRTGEFGTVDSIIPFIDTGNNVAIYLSNTSSFTAQGGLSLQAGKGYLIAHTRSNNVIATRICPVLTTAPVDGSAVVANSSVSGNSKANWSAAINAPDNLVVGDRNAGDRRLDHSLARLAFIPRALSNLEIAQLAYGMEISDLPTATTPNLYLRLSSKDDIADIGPYASTVTPSTTFATGTAPGFGYVPATAPPAFSANPVINGPAQVGVAVSFTPAQATGSPVPTYTYQWALNGVDISGSTGTTYTPLVADTGKTLTVRQIATNSVGTANATSAGVVVENAAAAITLNEYQAESIFSVTAWTDTSVPVPMSGTWTGATKPSKIEYQFYALDGVTVKKAWTDSAATIAADGTWTAKPAVPLMGRKKVLVRFRSIDANGSAMAQTPIATNRIGIGGNIGNIGSSSAYSWFTGASGTNYVANHESVSWYNGGWKKFGVDGAASQMAEYFSVQFDMPIGMLDTGGPGEKLDTWQYENSDPWIRFRNAVVATGGKLLGVFSSMGSNDAKDPLGVRSRAEHYAKLKAVIDHARTLTGQAALPVLWSGYNRRTDAQDKESDFARMAENDIGDYANVFHVQALDYELSSDGVHLTTTGFKACCDRMQYVFVEAVKNGRYLRGPKIVGMTYSGPTVRVALQHRGSTDFVPLSGITGFTITDSDASGVTPTISSAVHTDVNTVTLTTSRNLTSPVVKYLSGKAPEVGTPVYGNTAQALPMTVETDMATTFSDTAPVTPTVTSVTVSPTSATLAGGATQQFSATVTGTNSPSQSVSWTTTAGTISASGLFTAPASTSAAQSITIRATSTADSTKSATSVVTVPAVVVTPTVSAVTVSPSTATLAGGGAQQFSASVTGTNSPSQSVTWSTSAGTINSAGLFVAPAATTSVQVVTVTATSVQDNQKKGTAVVTVQATAPAPGTGTPGDFVPSAARTIKVRAASLGFTGGPFWDMANPFKPVGRMDPDSIIDITFDWSEVLDDIKSSIANVEFNLAGGLGTDKLVVGSKATVLVTRSGTGQISITSRMTTTSNPVRRMDATIFLKVEDL